MSRVLRDLDLMEASQEAKPLMSFGPRASPESIDGGSRGQRKERETVWVQSETLEWRGREREIQREIGRAHV